MLNVVLRKFRCSAGVIAAALMLAACGDPVDNHNQWATWRSYAGHADSSQYSSLTQINRDNVAELEVAWTYSSGNSDHRSTPLVIDDVMYLVANGGVTALDAATGSELWFAPDSVSASVRGLVYWQNDAGSDQRLLVIKQHYLQALDARNGAILNTFGANGRVDLREGLGRDPESITRIATMTPGRIFEDLIIMGSAVGDNTYAGASGDIRAYDVRTGERVWTFHTIPHPGEFGYETWPQDAWKTIGAANAWTAMSVDVERGIVYVPTGAPSYHFYGANRVGNNLFANSLIALNARTGERLWHFQAVHHDIWDYDLAMAPKLLTVERDGKRIDAVVLAGKQGFLFVFDRVTGEPIFPIEERAVPQSDVPGEVASPTQPFPAVLPPFANLVLTEFDLSPYADEDERSALAQRIRVARNEGLFTPPSLQGSVSAPGSRGGAQHGNGAVIPDAGLFYIAVVESPTIPKLEKRRVPGSEYFELSDPAEIYASTCADCHGLRGEGQPPLSEEDFLTVVKQGRGRMAAFPDLRDIRIVALMDYVDGLVESPLAEHELMPVADDVSETWQYQSGYHHFFSDNGLLGAPPWSKLIAYDLNQGTILWQKPYGDVIALARRGITGTGSLFPTNSLTATKGGLLFSTTNDRKIRAWDRDTGEVLWSADLPANPGGIPAVYEVGDRQFVVASAIRSNAVVEGEVPAQRAYIAFRLPVQDR
jgi:quinoprotein glucose dehydrogenase